MNLLTSITLATLLTITTSFAQIKDISYNYNKIDSVRIFSPIGNISSSDDYSIKPNVSLTTDYLEKFSNSLDQVTDFKAVIVENPELKELEYQKYFAKLMKRLDRLDNTTLFKTSIGDKLKNIIAAHPGRYFSFIFYSGFENVVEDPTLVSSLNKDIVVDAQANKLSYPLATEQPFLKNYVIVIDKQINKIVYYNKTSVASSPTKAENIQKQLKEVYNDLK